MTKFSSVFIFLLIALKLSANDGAYYSGGSTFYPLKEGKISMDKEILSFKVINKQCYVTIHFEFFNPENVSRKILVGFQAPQAAGDVKEEEIKFPQIFDFKVSQDSRLLPFQLKTAECEDCPLKEEQTISSHQAGSGIFVYLFEIEFRPGITSIDHSYRFRSGSSVMTDQLYPYILKTGAKWAGGTIKDLTVNIDMGNDSYFYVSDIFGKEANWSVLGIGKTTSSVYNNYEVDCKMIRILSGHLQIHCTNWNPQQNLEFGIIKPHCYEFAVYPKTLNRIMTAVNSLNVENLEDKIPYTKEELKFIRNTFFAQKGYVFSNSELSTYFSKFEWYIPNPNLKMSEIQFDTDVKLFIEEIQKKEKQ
ncbi:YARHG domain-containing protein [Fluviicola taffensis]|uniref:YARHG domain-containing protein n=1 Tax=Fluviicola taffensis (strain DSM 16823 / NCIMB 13979 / RW262) TaxID=755732 RepID=F2IC57_FLUTR|nr:YARHG domain-containing protein [Fluviicola taffensis]AEA43283.1 hypothetical protein Fluta_1288 [Fluviicola taffensis DSM 16823]